MGLRPLVELCVEPAVVSRRIRLDFPRETGLILRFARKSGNPFQTKQGNQHSCRDHEVRRSSNEVVPGTSVSLSSETGMSGNFEIASRVPNTVLHFKTERGTSLESL